QVANFAFPTTSLQIGSAASVGQPSGGPCGSCCAHERQQRSFGFASHCELERGIGLSVLLTNQPAPSSRIEQSFSSDSITIATSESGRKKRLRCASRTSSQPTHAPVLPSAFTVSFELRTV